MAIAFEQGVPGAGTSPLTVQITGVGAGNLLVAVIMETTANNRTFTSLASDNGGNFTAAVTYQNSGTLNRRIGIYYLPNCNAGTHNVTLTVSASASLYLDLFEFSGCDTASPFVTGDFFENASGTTKYHADVGEIDTSGSCAIVTGTIHNSDPGTVTYDADYTLVGVSSLYYIAPSAVTDERAGYTHSVTRTANSAIAAFKVAGTAAAGTPKRLALLGTG